MSSVKDLVCGKMVDPSTARREKLSRHDYCFCSNACRVRFLINPGRYLRR